MSGLQCLDATRDVRWEFCARGAVRPQSVGAQWQRNTRRSSGGGRVLLNGGGGLEPKSLCPKIAQINMSFCKLHSFPL